MQRAGSMPSASWTRPVKALRERRSPRNDFQPPPVTSRLPGVASRRPGPARTALAKALQLERRAEEQQLPPFAGGLAHEREGSAVRLPGVHVQAGTGQHGVRGQHLVHQEMAAGRTAGQPLAGIEDAHLLRRAGPTTRQSNGSSVPSGARRQLSSV